MTDKELLLIDLSARLPYGVMVEYESHIYMLKDIDYITVRIQDVERLMCAKSTMIESIKPYLRPMSSMTEEEVDAFTQFDVYSDSEYIMPNYDAIDWLNAHHFDYRGLIEKGLAIAVTEENNPYENDF